MQIAACAIATSCCISEVPSQWESRNFDLSQHSHFSTNLNETWNQKRYPKYDPTRKLWSMWNDGKGVCVGRAFPLLFMFFSVFLLTPTGHTRKSITAVYGSKRLFSRKVGPFGGLDNKKNNVWGSKLPQNMIFGGPHRHFKPNLQNFPPPS